jgi:hypothetical protein
MGDEVDHTLPSTAKIKKLWRYTSIPPHTFMAHSCTKIIIGSDVTHKRGTNSIFFVSLISIFSIDEIT